MQQAVQTTKETSGALDTPRGFKEPPDTRELLLLFAVSFLTMWITVFLLHHSAVLVLHYGDNTAYVDVATAILHWDFHNLQVQHFMGYPYFIAAISLLLHISPSVALWIIAVVSSAVSVWLAARMFGTVVAAYFAFSNFAWIQVSFLGGSEPISVALALGSLYSFRKRQVGLSASLASLAVTVRPLMIFLLIGIVLVLLFEKKFGQFLLALFIGLAIGALYVIPYTAISGTLS